MCWKCNDNRFSFKSTYFQKCGVNMTYNYDIVTWLYFWFNKCNFSIYSEFIRKTQSYQAQIKKTKRYIEL